MTAATPNIHDHTVREAFERYSDQRVNTAGERPRLRPRRPHRRRRVGQAQPVTIHDSLPNGYCGRPPQQDCPHPNACLTCPDFQTTPEFLDIHRRQADTNRRLIAPAEANGQFRLADNLRRSTPASTGSSPPSKPSRPATGDPRCDNTHHLVRAATDRHDCRHPGPRRHRRTRPHRPSLTFAAVACAGVSRGWLYKQPDLLIAALQLRNRTTPGLRCRPLSGRPTSLRQRLDAARTEIDRLASRTLPYEQIARALGEARIHR